MPCVPFSRTLQPNHGEFVAAETRHHPPFRRTHQLIGDLDKHCVAHAVTERVVNPFEVVQVYQQNGELIRATLGVRLL